MAPDSKEMEGRHEGGWTKFVHLQGRHRVGTGAPPTGSALLFLGRKFPA